MPAAIIFDVDGTLVDSNYQHAMAWYMAFREHEVVVPISWIHHHLGMGGDQLVSAVAGEQVEAQHGDALRMVHDAFFGASIDTVSVLEGARELIEELKRAGSTVVLASSAQEREINHYLDLLDVRELIDGWTTASDVEKTKPAPDLVLAALEKAGTEDAVMVGDTPWDVETAKKAGVPTYGVLTGGFSRAELEAAGAIGVFESVNEMRKHVGALTA